MEQRSSEGPDLTVIETVRCLDCGALYSKPAAGGIVQANPGCPECGYVGWISAAIPAPQRRMRRFLETSRTRREVG